ncbi:MAG TPA: flagellar FlbD family protein [Solirubrobacteraceae bacterium]|jgi:flagellar protein FlbD|nr:flagellar FlbD family protein [Solirubrobacteraceae bacterium]
MITLHRLGHSDEPFQLNSEMIVTVESTPDTVITLATGAKVVVAETPEEVAAAVHANRALVLSDAMRRRGTPRQPAPGPGARRGEPPRLSAVEDTPS